MNWISVKDRLPEYYKSVWVRGSNGIVFVGKLTGRSYEPPEKNWFNLERDGNAFPDNVTHWQPLEPPEMK